MEFGRGEHSLDRNSGITLCAVGDLMLGDHPAVMGHGVRSILEDKTDDWLFENVSETWSDADVLFGNLETVLSNTGMVNGRLESSELRGSPMAVSSLKNAGFNVINIANNHILQHGEEAFWETVDCLEKNGIGVVGLRDREGGLSSLALKKTLRGKDISFLGYSLCPEKYYDKLPLYAKATPEEMVRDVSTIKGECGLVVVSLHWGNEFMDFPSNFQRNLAHKIVEAGADLILGHHPHVLQGIEVYRDSIIAYSLGNFVFDMWQKRMRESVVLKMTLNTNEYKDLLIQPIYINSSFQPCTARGKRAREITKRSEHLSKFLEGNQVSHNSYRRREKYNLLRYRLECYAHFAAHLFRYDKNIIFQSVKRFFKRRFEEVRAGVTKSR